MVPEPVLDGRRVESLVRELRRYAPHYTPDLNLTDEQSVAPALMRIFAQLAETVLVRLGRTPHKHFVAFLDRLGIGLLPARPARAGVTFRLASGLNEIVRVPVGTRVTAAGTDDEIPFETTSELMAIPGVLSAAYGVDPFKDVIYAPPPGFLTQEIRTPTELVYKVQAFVAKGAKRLQLDHVTELTPGSFIRIGGMEKSVVETVVPEGNIITLEDPIGRDVDPDTTITPIRDFEVFDGIDLQEHVLYLGDADLFTVKEEAEITLNVKLVEDAAGGLTPFNVAWQFWTIVEEDSPDAKEDWYDLEVRSDGTAGFSSSGRVVLLKPDELEIKEREVGGITSRWVRAELRDKLPADGGALPEIDTIAIAVKSASQDGIPADQGFHNATPLDLQVEPRVGFFPFGTEPRQFDQFYIASKEAFSKREAEVTLNVELDLQTLAGPSLAVTTNGSRQLRAYSIGLRRRLYELNVDTGDWQILGDPAAFGISERPQGSGFLPIEDSVPSALIEGQDVYVFVNTEDSLAAENPPNRIWCHVRREDVAATWTDLGAPGPTPPQIQFSPAAVRSGGFARVFAVAGDGKLYSRAVTSTGEADGTTWVSHASPPGVTLNSPPFVTIAGNKDVLVFVNGNGLVHRFSVSTSVWLSLAQRNVFFTAVSRPFAQPFEPGVDAKVFVFGLEQGTEQWKLFECDTREVNGQFPWVDLGRPPATGEIEPAPEAHAPSGFIEDASASISAERKHIFLRGADNHLYERLDDDTATGEPRWEDRTRLGDPPLRDSPAVNVTPDTNPTTMRVFSASERNSLVTWEFEIPFKIPSGVIVAEVRTEYAPLEDLTTIPELSWEYWNGRGWLSLTVTDQTRNFLSNGEVRFSVPESIERTEVAGQDNFWIRARLVGGDYGRETFKIVNDTVVSEKSSLRPPKISTLRIVYEAPPVPPEVCLTFNNLDYLDQTAASRIGGAHFRPFERLERFENRSLTVFFGFDKPFKTGPVRLLIDAAEREFDESRPPELDWRFRKDRLWKELDAEDGSVALTRHGILTLSASEELTRETRFGKPLFWIAGSLRTDRGVSGADYPLPLLRGIFLNTVWALQEKTITDEIIGSSDGEPNQTLKFQHADVLEGEDIRVREALSAEERELIERESGKDSVVDREDLGGTWVRWRETLALFDAGPEDRSYLIDRAAGLVQFGDGVHGSIPPAGVDNIRAFIYQTGGGAIGNVEAGKIETLATAVEGIESVFNPTTAGGGSDKATTEAMLTIGPRRISHRDRAVSAEDFEELAQEASRQVAKVRCLTTTNLARRGAGKPDPCDQAQRHEALRASGWVSLILVPDSSDPRPCPSLELRRAVKDFLRLRAPSVLAAGERIVIRPPDYVEVGVEAEIFVTSLEQAATAETRARTTLETLLHPLRGGADGTGWEFGRPIWKSDVFSALERIDEIDRVENLRFHFRGGTDPERVVIGPNELLASGRHLLAIKTA